MAQPRLVKSLVALRDQVNKLAPNRSKASDGWIGDAAHAKRKSQHNPDPDGTVDALDITHDPKNGCDAGKIAEAIRVSKDKRVGNVIYNRQIFSGSGKSPFVWRKYTGANAHTQHIHIDVIDALQDDARPWAIDSAFSKVPAKPDPKLTAKQKSAVMHRGSKGEFVTELQNNLVALGYGPMAIDGVFGIVTERAVKKFQSASGLKADGWAGPRTLEAIGKALKDKETAPKIAAAGKIVDDAAGKGVSKTEVVTTITGVTGVATVVTEAVNSVRDGATSLMSLGPWLLLALVLAGGAAFVFYDRRQKRLAAQAAKQVMA